MRSWAGAGVGVACCFTAAVLGKLVGIAGSRIWLWRDIRHLTSLFGKIPDNLVGVH